MKNILFAALIILIFSACNKNTDQDYQNPLVFKDGFLYHDSLSSKPFTGRNKSKMLDMVIEYEVVNGLKQGDFITYYPNGKVQMYGSMKQNKNVGLWKYYYQNGVLESSGYFNNDLPDSTWQWYNISGKLFEEGNYIGGKRNGTWKNYDSLGKLYTIKTYLDGTLKDSIKVD